MDLAVRYISDRFLPDKAIDLVDEVVLKVRLRGFTTPPNLSELEQEIENLSKEKEAAIVSQDYEKAAELRDEERKLQQQLAEEKSKWEQEQGQKTELVTEAEIAEVVSSWTGVPVQQLTQAEAERLLNLEELLGKRVIGQEKAITAISHRRSEELC